MNLEKASVFSRGFLCCKDWNSAGTSPAANIFAQSHSLLAIRLRPW